MILAVLVWFGLTYSSIRNYRLCRFILLILSIFYLAIWWGLSIVECFSVCSIGSIVARQ